jgi:hypothetical protein
MLSATLMRQRSTTSRARVMYRNFLTFRPRSRWPMGARPTRFLFLIVLCVVPVVIGATKVILHSDKPPHFIWMNGDKWMVIDVSHLEEGKLSVTMCGQRSIYLRSELPRDQKAEVLHHEIMHALTCSSDGEVHNEKYNNLTSEHNGIWWASPRLLQVQWDNPELNRWFMNSRPR